MALRDSDTLPEIITPTLHHLLIIRNHCLLDILWGTLALMKAL